MNYGIIISSIDQSVYWIAFINSPPKLWLSELKKLLKNGFILIDILFWREKNIMSGIMILHETKKKNKKLE